MAEDIRDRIFFKIRGRRYLARISSQGEGILSGTDHLRAACKRLGIRLKNCKRSGTRVRPMDTIAVLQGDAKQIAQAEEELVGWMAKASGIATAARKAKTVAGGRLRVVSGAWKKMPPPLKELVRQAVADGGLPFRISEKPFIYLDKNYVKMLGGVHEALAAVKDLKPSVKVVQLKSNGRRLLQEASLAAGSGASTIMIDTGDMRDLERVDQVLKEQGLRKKVRLAFAGEISIEDLPILRSMPVEIVDIGKAIVDAPLLDMKMDVEAEE
jgi:nicotinate-nucleotide pyrophosphorylase (carboxylating)